MSQTAPLPEYQSTVPAHLADDEILSLDQWRNLAGQISLSTARRIIGRGEISTVKLSERRIGITVREHRRWTAARTQRAT